MFMHVTLLLQRSASDKHKSLFENCLQKDLMTLDLCGYRSNYRIVDYYKVEYMHVKNIGIASPKIRNVAGEFGGILDEYPIPCLPYTF